MFQRVLLFDLLLLPVVYLARRATTAIHELGHLLVAWGFGAPPKRVVVSVFGGGWAQSHWRGRNPWPGRFLTNAGGMVASTGAGIAALVATRWLRVDADRWPPAGTPAKRLGAGRGRARGSG